MTIMTSSVPEGHDCSCCGTPVHGGACLQIEIPHGGSDLHAGRHLFCPACIARAIYAAKPPFIVPPAGPVPLKSH